MQKSSQTNSVNPQSPVAGTGEARSFAQKYFRRNYTLGVTSGAIFGLVDSIVSPYLVLSLFVSDLGGSNFLVGLLPAIYNGGWFLPQFLMSHRMQRLPRKLPIYVSAAVVRIFCWLLLTAATFVTANSNPGLLLAVFFILLTIYSLASGIAGAPFMDIVAKTIPAERRGTYFGRRDFFGALVAIGGGYIVNFFLNPKSAPPFPLNFGSLFLITLIAIAGGLGAFALVKEPTETAATREITFRDQLTAARNLLRENAVYRRYLLTRMALAVSDIASPFYAIYAIKILNVPAENVGLYIALSTASILVTNPFLSRVSDRRGNRILLIGAAYAMIATPLIALAFGFLPTGSALGLPFGIIFFIAGVVRAAVNIANPSYLLEIAPALDRSLYIGFTNTILGLATFVPIVGGILLDLTGFQVVFVLTMLVSASALSLAYGMTEPRQK